MSEIKRERISRADGKTINLVQRRGHLSYCYNACCCGRTDRGYEAVPVDTYKKEWFKRKLRNVVHLTKGGCLGPCTLANVASLLFDGNSVWFHSVNSAWQVEAIFDYIESMVKADRFLVPPASLTEFVFQFYSWKGQEPSSDQVLPVKQDGVVFLTHADTDLLTLQQACQFLPDGFPKVTGVNLQSVRTEAHMAQLLQTEIATASVLLLRVLGRPSSIPGFQALLKKASESGQQLIVVSGTEGVNPEFAAISNVSSVILEETTSYFQYGGYINLLSLLRFLSDHLLLTTFGYEPPAAQPEHGIYHPNLVENAELDDLLKSHRPGHPTIGITFYRAHYLSGNTAFIDALIFALEDLDLNVIPVYTSSLKAFKPGSAWPAAFDFFRKEGTTLIDVLVNTISFAVYDGSADRGNTAFSVLDVPVLQAISSGMNRGSWENSARGLNPLDTAMNVAIPEMDGRIITVPVSFKANDRETRAYLPVPDRIERIASLARRFARLRHLPNRQKRIAFVFTNSGSKASQIGNAVGLDAPESLLHILAAMQAEDYKVGDLPDNGTKLIHELIARCAYDETYLSGGQLAQAVGRVPFSLYQQWFDDLPDALRQKMSKQWGPAPGSAFVHEDCIALAGLEFENILVALQPPRGYGMDPDAIYHQPDLAPTHHYHAFYRWLRDGWKADAIVHVGKHGTLEWLPGKSVGLSQECFPDALLCDIPLFYPFIINDPGEGSQAKRRAHAVVVDHLTPPLTTADSYGELAELTRLVDEYYQVESLDPSKLPLLQRQIWELIRKSNLDKDLSLMLRRNHGDHVHEWDEELSPEGIPAGLTEMGGKDIAHLIEDIDGYLCELGAAQIRNGLHTFGKMPEGAALNDMLQSLTRLPNIGIGSLPAAMCRLLGFDLQALRAAGGQRLPVPYPALNELARRSLATHTDVLETVDLLIAQCFTKLQERRFNPNRIPDALSEILPDAAGGLQEISVILTHVCDRILPDIAQTEDEVTYLLQGLSGGFIPAGPSGAPSRGMAHILPTGRNFYTSDPRALPSQAAWEVGRQLAGGVLDRHLKESGFYPENVGISIWGTSAMRTQGDDVAEILALMGVRPVWQAASRRVTGLEIISLEELGRPRIDVMIRISGFFRDAFPHLIELLDQAFHAVASLDEPEEQNFIRKHYRNDVQRLQSDDISIEEAEDKAGYRIFGSPPGSYGAGILPLIQERNWQTDDDFAETYINWGGYAYTATTSGVDARKEFKQRLRGIEIALHNQDNREHDLFDSDDYLQFHGGMIASIRSLTGQQPKSYFSDTQDPASPVVRELKEEVLRVFRTRVMNPKWLDSIQRHGYKGGLELTATVDYIFGYDATAHIADDWMYQKIAENYALDERLQQFLAENNPWALKAIAERLLEANERKLWTNAPGETLQALRDLYLESETILEGKNEV